MEKIPCNLTDEELVRRAQRGDAEAFGCLYDRYVEEVYRFFYYRTFNRQDAEDLAGETFLRAWEHIRQIRTKPAVRFKAWLLRIARNLWIDRYRKKQEFVSLEALPLEEPMDASPEEKILQEEMVVWLTRALAQLPEPMREVVVCRFLLDLRPAEIAEIMGIRENHVRILQYRALHRMRQWLKAHGISPDFET